MTASVHSVVTPARPLLVALPAHHVLSAINAEDLAALAAWVPPSGQQLVRVLGVPGALALLNGLGGVQLWVPKGPCNNPAGARTWAYVAQMVGEAAMLDLAREWGGQWLEVPTLDALRKERRNRAMRCQFDQLTAKAPEGAGLSKARAVQELCLHFAPVTWRQVEAILDKPSHPGYASAQSDLTFDF